MFTKSNYSFLEGASHPHEYVEQCQKLGLEWLALCDRDGVYGIVRAHAAIREADADVKLIVGSEITLEDESTIYLLAQTRRGYANLCELISKGRLRCEKGASRVRWREVCEHAEECLALWGGRRSLLVAEGEPPDDVARHLKAAFGDRLYAVAMRHRRAEEVDQEARLLARAERYDIPIAAGYEVLYHTPERRQLQDRPDLCRPRRADSGGR